MVCSTLLCLVLLYAVGVLGFPATLKLERSFPTNHGVELKQLTERDGLRHHRILHKYSDQNVVVGFGVYGTYDPFDAGLYYTKIKLGSPAKEYYVLIDTGSDLLWVGCKPCQSCPTSSTLQIPITIYDPANSSTSSAILCSDERCSSKSNSCSDNQCTYDLHYGDGSETSGYYVSDLMHFRIIVGETDWLNTSASVLFGCSMSETGRLSQTDRTLDGIMGLGRQSISVISQLSSQGIAPNSFAHCLAGGDGGGILAFGTPVMPDLVFTPLVKSMWHYNVNLESISVNVQTLTIDPSVFALSDHRLGTIIDSGTTLVYITEEAYTPVVDAIKQAASNFIHPFMSSENLCYLFDSSYFYTGIFPMVRFNFAGGASMHFKPQDYLIRQISTNGSEIWCMGIQRSSKRGLTILGELTLKDKTVVYDLDGQQIGWAESNCDQIFNISGSSHIIGSGCRLRPSISILFVLLFIFGPKCLAIY